MNSDEYILYDDDVGALVFDPGHHSLRVGYAHEASPMAAIPAWVGVVSDDTNTKAATSNGMNIDSKPNNNNVTYNGSKYLVDTTFLNVPRSNMEIQSYMKDGMIENWDLFEKVLDYSYATVLKTESQYHPVLFSECSWNVRSNREHLTELMFEKYKVPAFFVVKNAVLAAFTNGRKTALVVDSGATHTSVVPVLEGYVLREAIVKSPLGADFLSQQCRQYLESQGIDLTPAYAIATKDTVREREPPRFTMKQLPEKLTPSWQRYMLYNLVQDFQMSTTALLMAPFDECTTSQIPSKNYEFPSGYHQDFGCERLKLAESLFDHAMLGASQLVSTSINMCDADIRLSLYNSIVLTGGNTLLLGFRERLYCDLRRRTATNIKIGMTKSIDDEERRFGAWIGGSIMAGIGPFQQMWISSREYEEFGKGLVERKCP